MSDQPDLITISIDSPIGALRADACGDSLCGLYLPTSRWPAPTAGDPKRGGVLAETARQLRAYFAGKLTAFDLPLAPAGTPFQLEVWRALVAIPFGETASYGELARSIGRPDASRAVGAANGRNPISIIVPCHRVIGSTGSLVGYGGGLPAKRWLLAHESKTPQLAFG